MYSTKPRNSKWAVVNDGDDGDDNDDEDALNKIWMMESFKEQNFFYCYRNKRNHGHYFLAEFLNMTLRTCIIYPIIVLFYVRHR